MRQKWLTSAASFSLGMRMPPALQHAVGITWSLIPGVDVAVSGIVHVSRCLFDESSSTRLSQTLGLFSSLNF